MSRKLTPDLELRFLDNGGEMGRRIRSFDWAGTPLGPPDTWPLALKASVATCLNSRFPILIWWGKGLMKIYNDAYAEIIAKKHPAALGSPGKVVWPEIWNIIGPMLEGVMERGEATWSENLLLELERNGFREECYFTFSYSPIYSETGDIVGVFTPVQETTREVIGARRMRTLREVGDAIRAIGKSRVSEVCRIAGATMGRNPQDIPFAAIYLGSQPSALALEGSTDLSPSSLFPAAFTLEDGPWFLPSGALPCRPEIVAIPGALAAAVPLGAWPDPARQAVVLPLGSEGGRAGILVVGVSPRKLLDDDYLSFLSLLADHVDAVIANARILEETRRRAEARDLLAAIVESSDDAIISKDLNGIVVSWNRAAERIFGYRAEEMIGRHISTIVPAEAADDVPTLLGRIRAGERVESYETNRVSKEGKIINVSLTVSPIHDADGVVIGASKVARDITRRKQSQKQLQESAERRRAIFDGTVGYLGLVAPDGTLIEANRALLDFAGSRHENVVGHPIWHAPWFAYTPGAPEQIGKALLDAAQGKPAQFESALYRPDGALTTFYISLHSIQDEKGKIVLTVIEGQDITDRKKAELALRDSEAKFRHAIDSMPQLVWSARSDGYHDLFNKQWFEYTGLSFEQSNGDGCRSAYHPDDAAEVDRFWQHSIKTGEPFEVEFRCRRKDGRYLWFLGRATPIRDDFGQIVRWFGTCTDIDAWKRSAAALRLANQDLEQFAYSASHDLQEPLRAVLIYSDLLAKRCGPTLDSQALQFMGFLRNGAARMELLVRDLLAYTQVAAAGEPISELVDVRASLEDVQENLAEAIRESGASVTVGPLPWVPVEAIHLQQIFQNLLGNAIKYRSARPPRIEISASQRQLHWLFAVSDNGIGIDPAYRERIFGIFRRLHTTEEYPGTGIGLAICQRIVERYGGRIWVEAGREGGSTFCFTLPRRSIDESVSDTRH